MENKITLSVGSIFSVEKTDLSGNQIAGKLISSHEFILFESKKITADSADNLPHLLYEYSVILKLLVKNEMLEEMIKRIDNIDTFYN